VGDTASNKKLAALMFTDIVGSVELQRQLGTEAYTRYVRRHDAIFKECLESVSDAGILNETGDGFLVRFSDPSDAVSTALRLQHRLRDERCEGQPIRLRIGLNMGMVTEMEEAIRGETRVVGMAINLAARVMEIADAGQILMTRSVYDDARQFVREHPQMEDTPRSELPALKWVAHGTCVFKGTDQPLEIFEVGAEGLAPFTLPAVVSATSPAPRSTEVSVDVIRNSDVYISFAPVDDRPLSPGQDGWISQFHRNLETRIEQLSGEPIKVIQRPPLDDASTSTALIEAVPGAKAMVTVVSPPFVKSSDCVRETEAFWRSAQEAGNLWLEDKTRLLKVVKTPVADSDVPQGLNEMFSNLPSFDFFSIDPETGRMWEFDETFGVDARRRYYERVYDLAYELCHILKAFQSGKASREAREKGQTVFLAETTGDVRSARDRLKRELMERGHVVLPDRPLPLSGPQLEAAVKECLERCTVAVHLVGSVYGLVPEAAEHSMVELQNRITSQWVEADGDRLTRLIWLPRERPEPETRQAEFIRQLVEDPAAQRGADLVEGSLEEFKEILIDLVTPKAEPASEGPAARTGPDGPRRVYLICDRADEEAVEPLEDYLFDQGFEVATPVFEGNEPEIAVMHRQNLLHCDAVLIYYGHGSKGWVETKLMDLQQAPGYGRKQPIVAKVVYVAPPLEDRRKQRFRTHQATVVHCDEAWNPDLLGPFVAGLKSVEGGAG